MRQAFASMWPESRLVVSEFVFKESHLFVPVPHVLKQIKIADDVEDSKRSSTTDLGLTHQGSSGCCAAVTWPPRSAYAKHDLCQCAAKVTPGIGCEELWACAPEICCTLLSLWIEAERERENVSSIGSIGQWPVTDLIVEHLLLQCATSSHVSLCHCTRSSYEISRLQQQAIALQQG